MKTKTIIIAGPCAAEDREQILTTAKELKKNDIKIMRASLWKPRTKPGFSGVGINGLDWLIEAAQLYDLTIATEVMIPQHVEEISKKLENFPKIKLILWLGSRNQNHLIQGDIVKTMMNNLPQAKLMVKNQPWRDLNHWQGIVDHVLNEGFPKEQLLVCHRGFYPNPQNNPYHFRNKPDTEMMNQIRKSTNLPIIFDASHTAGNRKNVFKVTEQILNTKNKIDGFIIETHPNPEKAKTDSQQQLNFDELQEFIKIISTQYRI